MARTKGAIGKNQPKGSRTASGRLRARPDARVEPCEGVQRRHDLYGIAANDTGDAEERKQRRRDETDTCDAIGRAFNAGLLHRDRARAKELLNAGRRIHRQYWRHIVDPSHKHRDSLARYMPESGASPFTDDEKDRIIEQALNDALALVKAEGHNVRFAFDQLVVDLNPDSGPVWIDRIVEAHRARPPRRASEGDYFLLDLAIKGLEAIA